MKYLQKQQLLEQVIYLSMWLLILCIPPINLLLDDDHTLQAGELKNVILETGMLVLPFFVLFLIHNFLLIPQLFLKKYYVRYMLAVIFTIGILFLYMPGWLEALHPELPLQGQKERTFEPAESWLPLPQLPLMPDSENGRPPIRPPFQAIHIAIAVLLVGFNLSIRLFLKSLRDDEMLKDLERQRLESELQYLKYQLNPHFFMNTLNNIYALVDLNTEQAKKTIIELFQADEIRSLRGKQEPDFTGTRNTVPGELHSLDEAPVYRQSEHTHRVSCRCALRTDTSPAFHIPVGKRFQAWRELSGAFVY